MSEHENSEIALESITLPYHPGEFQEAADRIGNLAETLARYPNLNTVSLEMRTAAAALARAESLLRGSEQAQAEPQPAEQVEPAPAPEAKQEKGTRGEWKGNIGRQPEYNRLQDGRIRAVFFLAQHPDPTDRDKTDWIRCYSLGRHAEALQAKGRLAGAEVLVRGSLQGVRPYTRKDGTTIEQPTVYCYGVRVLRPPKAAAPKS